MYYMSVCKIIETVINDCELVFYYSPPEELFSYTSRNNTIGKLLPREKAIICLTSHSGYERTKYR